MTSGRLRPLLNLLPPSMPEHIYLIRHGEAYNNILPDGLREIEHPANPPLTPLGEQQALELKPVLAAFGPEAVIVSPFLRAVQTIHPFVTPDLTVSVDRRMGERFFSSVFSSFPGIDPSFYQRYGPRLIPDELCRDRSSFPDYPETRESVRDRVSSLWKEWKDVPICRIAFVGHGASLAALLNFLLPEYPNNTGHGNCGCSHLEKTPGGWTARRINCQDHLTQTNGQVIH